MKMVIESGLLAIQSGLLKSQVFVGDGSETEGLFVGLKTGKESLVEHYLTKAMENVARLAGLLNWQIF
jgi:hypothetical protein